MPKPQSLADWLALLETRHPLAIELGLERVAEVAHRLRLERPAPRVVSVAGTNGKGSCVALIEALLRCAGMRVGAYTSPHLLTYNERVRIDGQPTSDASLCAAFARIEAARGDIRLTYFEVGTLAALLLFAEARVDVAVLEVGMGGRLDAVNIVAPDVAVITSIALDHQAWLGTDREQIGVEKAGIARPGIVTVCGDPDPPNALRTTLAAIGSPTLFIGSEDFALRPDASGLELTCTQTDGGVRCYPGLPAPQLPQGSAACAVQALVALGLAPRDDDVATAFAETRLAGRFQRLRWRERAVILDVAHNPAAARLLAQRLVTLGRSAAAVHGVVGALADKDLAGMLVPLLGRIHHWHCCELPGVARAAPATRLATVLYNVLEGSALEGGALEDNLFEDNALEDNALEDNALEDNALEDEALEDSVLEGNVREDHARDAAVPSPVVNCHPDPVTGLAAALHSSREGDLILVFGSFHTVAPVLALLADRAEAGGGEVG